MIPVEAYRAVIQSQDKTTYARAILDLRHWMIENGPHMPVYHFTSPECWINDPNGVIYHKGCITSSISMTSSPTANHSKRRWGHAVVSKDLVHWDDWPTALWLDTKYDCNGEYSGNMVIDDMVYRPPFTQETSAVIKKRAGCWPEAVTKFLAWEKKMVRHNDQRPSASLPNLERRRWLVSANWGRRKWQRCYPDLVVSGPREVDLPKKGNLQQRSR